MRWTRRFFNCLRLASRPWTSAGMILRRCGILPCSKRLRCHFSWACAHNERCKQRACGEPDQPMANRSESCQASRLRCFTNSTRADLNEATEQAPTGQPHLSDCTHFKATAWRLLQALEFAEAPLKNARPNRVAPAQTHTHTHTILTQCRAPRDKRSRYQGS